MLSGVGRKSVKSVQRREYDELVAFLRESRESLGVSQEALAGRLGWLQSQVSQVETGDRRLDIIEFFDYAKALEIEPSELTSRLILRIFTKP